MKQSFLQAVRNYPLKDKTLKFIQGPWGHTAIGAAFLGAVAGGATYNFEKGKEGHIPIAFSEVGKIMRQGQLVPPLTRHYASLNDVLMKVFEAMNAVHQNYWFDKLSHLASELEYITNPSFKVHRQIPEYAKEFPEISRKAMESLKKITNARKDLHVIIQELERVWVHNSRDVEGDSGLMNSSVGMIGDYGFRGLGSGRLSRRDYTIHRYTYRSLHGEKANRLMAEFFRKYPDLELERLILPKETDPENEYAIEQSMERELKGKIPTREQSLAYIRTWAEKSNLSTYQPIITDNHKALSGIAHEWSQSVNTARSGVYRTSFQADLGPREYRTIKTALQYAREIDSSARAIEEGVLLAGQAIPALNAKIREFVDVELNGKPGDSGKLKSEIVEIATTAYKKNFEKGFDVRPSDWGNVIFVTLLATIAGGALGAGFYISGEEQRQMRRTYY